MMDPYQGSNRGNADLPVSAATNYKTSMCSMTCRTIDDAIAIRSGQVFGHSALSTGSGALRAACPNAKAVASASACECGA